MNSFWEVYCKIVGCIVYKIVGCFVYIAEAQHLKAFIKLLPGLSHQLGLNPFLQFLGDRACRVQLFGVLVPLVQRHLVQLGLGRVQSLFHALKSGVAPVGRFVGVAGGGCCCWSIRKTIPFVELLLQYVGIPEKCNVTLITKWRGTKCYQGLLSLEQRLEGDGQKEMRSNHTLKTGLLLLHCSLFIQKHWSGPHTQINSIWPDISKCMHSTYHIIAQ